MKLFLLIEIVPVDKLYRIIDNESNIWLKLKWPDIYPAEYVWLQTLLIKTGLQISIVKEILFWIEPCRHIKQLAFNTGPTSPTINTGLQLGLSLRRVCH